MQSIKYRLAKLESKFGSEFPGSIDSLTEPELNEFIEKDKKTNPLIWEFLALLSNRELQELIKIDSKRQLKIYLGKIWFDRQLKMSSRLINFGFTNLLRSAL